jgi:hypothetical protein
MGAAEVEVDSFTAKRVCYATRGSDGERKNRDREEDPKVLLDLSNVALLDSLDLSLSLSPPAPVIGLDRGGRRTSDYG